MWLWEINDEILRIKYFCKEKIERASAFTESDKSGVRFDDLNTYFVEAIKSRDKGYFEAFIRAYEPVLQSRAERFVAHYNLSADDTEDIKQIFLEALWFAFLGYDAADHIPLLQYVKKAATMRQLDYIRTTKNACTVPTQNGYAELRKVMRIYNSAPELSADARIALAVKETGFAEEKVSELVSVGKACEYPVGIVPAEENENAADGTVADELIEDPSVSLFDEVLRSIYRAHFRDAADRITPKDKQILSLSLGVCFDCFGVFKPNTYAEIALKQGASGEKSIEKKRKAAVEKFARELCDMGFCDGVSLKQTAITVIKEKDKEIVQSAAYAYTPYGDGKAGEILYTAAGKHLRFIKSMSALRKQSLLCPHIFMPKFFQPIFPAAFYFSSQNPKIIDTNLFPKNEDFSKALEENLVLCSFPEDKAAKSLSNHPIFVGWRKGAKCCISKRNPRANP